MLADRLIQIVEAETDQKIRFKTLEEITGISKDSWIAVMRKRQRPTVEMIEAIARQWPDYAYWLACGATEPERGHIAPKTYKASYPIRRGMPQPWATAERQYMQMLLRSVPPDGELKVALDEKIRDEIFKLKKGHLIPGVHINYETIMRILNEEMKDDFFLIECDEKYREIVTKRWKHEKEFLKELNDEREKLRDSIHFNGLIQTSINATKASVDNLIKGTVKTIDLIKGTFKKRKNGDQEN
jgi:hypothetical protein